MLDKTLDANSSKISRNYEKLPQKYRWLPKSKELISQVVDKAPLCSVNVKIKKIDVSVGPDLLNLFSDSYLEFEVTPLPHVLASTFTSSRVEGKKLTQLMSSTWEGGRATAPLIFRLGTR